jgi:hypothetical protein
MRPTAALVLLLASACATPVRPIPPTLDPANPEAEDAPRSPPLTPLDSPVPEAATTDVAAQPAVIVDAGAPRAPMAHDHSAQHAAKSSPDPTVGKATAQEYTCPMHPEVRSSTPGTCPRCGMKLEPVKKKEPAPEFTCPMHPEVRSTTPGKCPKCGMKLIPVAAAQDGPK